MKSWAWLLGLISAVILAGCQTDLPLADLKSHYGAPPSRFLPMDGIEVHWRDEGPSRTARTDHSAASEAMPDAPAILLLHGTGASLHTWDGWAGPLSAQWRVVRLDLPGFGLTGPHPSGDYSPAATVDFLERFVNAAGLGRFAIAGNSLGGLVAWRFALRHPDRVTALILIDSAGYPADLSGPGTVGLRLARTPIVSELMRWAPVRAGVRNSLEGVYGSPEKVTPDLVDRYSDLLRRPGNRVAMGERARSMSNNTQWEQIQTIRIPTLIQWGGRDEWIPPVQGERFTRDIANSTLIVYPGLGHVPMEEDPQATVADAIAFLRKASGLRDSGRN